MVKIYVRYGAEHQDLPLPSYQSALAAGMDIAAAAEAVIMPGQWQAVPTGLEIALPAGFEAQVRPRSGLALKHGITVLNAPGTIDADYRGEIKVLLINHSSQPFAVERGMRIAQLVVAPVCQAELEVRTSLDETERGSSGFGSSGR
jgi:dUTP pyrophosphatase